VKVDLVPPSRNSREEQKRKAKEKANSLTVKKSPLESPTQSRTGKMKRLRKISSVFYLLLPLHPFGWTMWKNKPKRKTMRNRRGRSSLKPLKVPLAVGSNQTGERHKRKQRKRRFIVGEEKSPLEPAQEGS
jgi:hypothetical protein